MSTSVVTNYGDSCCKVLVDSDWASQLRSELQFLSQPVARIVSDDNNGLNEKTGYWFMQAEPLCRRYCKNKFDSFPQFSSPSLSIL